MHDNMAAAIKIVSVRVASLFARVLINPWCCVPLIMIGAKHTVAQEIDDALPNLFAEERFEVLDHGCGIPAEFAKTDVGNCGCGLPTG